MNYIFYLIGSVLILFGIIVVLFPQILVALIAAFFIIVGITIIGYGKRMSNFRKGPPNNNIDIIIK